VYQSLTTGTLQEAVSQLAKQDPLIKELVENYGFPPLWRRTQSFETLVHIILEQKVSLASAKAVMNRVKAHCPTMDPTQFLDVAFDDLKTAGVSERKISYCQSIALSLVTGDLKLKSLRNKSDTEVMDQLIAIRGIGPWTAGVYLLMAMRRPDSWASGDRALVVSYARSAQLTEIPSYKEFDHIAERWRPHRAAAARVLWHAYLSRMAQ